MLRCFILGACLACWTISTGKADEPSPCCELPGIGHLPPDIWSCPLQPGSDEATLSRPAAREPGPGLPRSEHDFLSRPEPSQSVPRAHLPSFQIFEDPLPSPLILTHSGPCLAPCCQKAKAVAVPKPRYDLVPHGGPAVATVSDETPAPAFSNLTVPMPLADPAAMVVQLFEKLEAAEHRASEANRRLAEAEAELAVRRHAPAAAQSGTSAATSATVVTLQMQCFEIDLDAVAKSNVELTGICRQALSEQGLAALVARGAFASCCSSEANCSSAVGCSSIADPPASAALEFGGVRPVVVGCSSNAVASCTAACGTEECADCPCGGQCAAQEAVPVATSPAPAKEACCSDSHQFVEDQERLAELVDQLKHAGLLRHVSHPRLMTRSGEIARMKVGRQVAYRSGGAEDESAVQNVSFCSAGTEIEVRPIVMPGPEGHRVQVELRARWTAFDEAAFRDTGLPVSDERSVQSIVELPAGRTAVVADLVAGDEQQAAAAPHTAGRREFVVLITPKIATSMASQPQGDARR